MQSKDDAKTKETKQKRKISNQIDKRLINFATVHCSHWTKLHDLSCTIGHQVICKALQLVFLAVYFQLFQLKFIQQHYELRECLGVLIIIRCGHCLIRLLITALTKSNFKLKAKKKIIWLTIVRNSSNFDTIANNELIHKTELASRKKYENCCWFSFYLQILAIFRMLLLFYWNAWYPFCIRN